MSPFYQPTAHQLFQAYVKHGPDGTNNQDIFYWNCQACSQQIRHIQEHQIDDQVIDHIDTKHDPHGYQQQTRKDRQS